MSLLKKFYLTLLLVAALAIVFLIVQPRTQHILFAHERQADLARLVMETQKQQDINLYSYWQFREFYSPGYFEYKKNGFSPEKNEVIQSLKKIDSSAKAQLFFLSSRITSIGGQTTSTEVPIKPDNNDHLIFQSKTVAIMEDDKQTTIVFLKPVTEIKKVNGFLQYQLVLDKNFGDMWLEFTRIKKD